MLLDTFTAMVLGIVEGLTEFIPVSSTGHLLLVEHFFGFDDETFGKSFAVLIQLGAILALISIYFVRLWKIALALPRDPDARRFTLGVNAEFFLACHYLAAKLQQDSVVFRRRLRGRHLLWGRIPSCGPIFNRPSRAYARA